MYFHVGLHSPSVAHSIPKQYHLGYTRCAASRFKLFFADDFFEIKLGLVLTIPSFILERSRYINFKNN
ncbi:MAG: hypothetical protein ACD_21C00084G0002 [uncultured bacterium]|nr:MAG: hypothetical protein ACD_21C00084G0002 [uncultured bacterium]